MTKKYSSMFQRGQLENGLGQQIGEFTLAHCLDMKSCGIWLECYLQDLTDVL